MLKRMKTNEGIQYEKLTPEQMKARGILGRLVGVCADFVNPTRNGRGYSERLWENVFSNPIMQEKIKNGVCFGELGHPEDRTEVDMEKIAVCLREQPTKNDKGQLCACFDILDTPNGRILKTLCDYGSIVGVSSRGQGDLITDAEGNEAVDPDTYECECFDVVLVPAVKEARMQYVKESLDSNTLNLKKALNESLNKASEEEKKVMEKTLEELNINVKEAFTEFDSLPVDEESFSEELNEDEKVEEKEVSVENSKTDDIEELPVDEPVDVTAEIDIPVEPELTVATENEEEVETEEKAISDEKPTEVPVEEVAEKIEEVADEIKEVVEPTKEVEAAIDEIVAEKQAELVSQEPKAEEKIDVEAEEKSDEDVDEDIKEECNNESCADKSKEGSEEISEANDNGAVELLKSLEEQLREKVNLEKEIKDLQEKLAVSDTKVNKALEECNRYKEAVARLSLISKEAKDLKESSTKLEESLKEKDAEIANQKVRIARLVKSKKESVNESLSLTESVSSKVSEINSLKESLSRANDEIKVLKEQLSDKKNNSETQVTELNESLAKATKLKESYKNLANKAVNKYIDVQANMLGITSADIKRKLGESYSLEDVDKVCADLRSYQINISKLPFDVNKKLSVRVNEGINRSQVESKTKKFEDDDIDDSLIRLANIR